MLGICFGKVLVYLFSGVCEFTERILNLKFREKEKRSNLLVMIIWYGGLGVFMRV